MVSSLAKAASFLEWYSDPVAFFREVAKQEPVIGQRELLRGLLSDENRFLVCAACLAKGTPIQLVDGSIRPIEDVKVGDKVLSYDESLHKIVPKEVERVIDNGLDIVYRFKSRNRGELFLTNDHPLLTRKGWTSADDFESYRNRHSKLKTFNLDSYDSSDVAISDERIKLVALLISEGHYGKRQTPKITNNDLGLLEEMKSIAEKEFGLSPRLYPKNKGWDLVLSYGNHISSPLIDYLREIGIYGQVKRDKRLPSIFSRLSNRQIRLFLDYFIKGDGCIRYQRRRMNNSELPQISIYTGLSSALAQELTYLLNRLGIYPRSYSRKRRTWNRNYFLSFSGKENLERLKSNSDSLKVIEVSSKIKGEIGLRRIYDLKIKNGNNFVANGFIVHNSGVGKTRVLAVGALWYVTVMPYILKRPVKVLILSGSLEQSKTLYEYSREFIDNSPIIEADIEERLKTETRFKSGSILKALPCSERSYYGKHVNLLIIDEAALKDIPENLIDHALSIVGPVKGSKLIMSSTPYEANSRFARMWEEGTGWNKIKWSTQDCSWFTPESIEEARQALSKEQFAIRWEGKIVTASDAIIRRESLKSCIMDVKPRRSLEPITFGVDWGFVHPTVVTVAQKEQDYWNILEVRYWRKARIDTLYDEIVALYNKYKPDSVYADSSHIFENNKLTELGLPIYPIHFRKEKELMLVNLISMIEHTKLRIFEEEIELIAQLRDYRRGKKKDDDWVDSCMLAVKEGIESRNVKTFYRVVEYA